MNNQHQYLQVGDQKLCSELSPIEKLSIGDHNLWVKRDDLLAPMENDPLCGNKWRKLKYNLIEAKEKGYQKLLTFGGAYSNHIAAVASAAKHFNFESIGIIRGEAFSTLSHTLQKASADGMELQFVDRSTYRRRKDIEYLKILEEGHPEAFIIPEGGTNHLAIAGVAEMVPEIIAQFEGLPDYICLSCGTGGTMAGIVTGLAGRCNVIGFSALKGNFLKKEVEQMVDQKYTNWEINTDFHYGGYAKFTYKLIQFIQNFDKNHGIPLDPIYTAKLFSGVIDLVARGFFPKGSSVLVIHTGGLQGVIGWEERFKIKISN